MSSRFSRLSSWALLSLLLAVSMAACGGGGGGDSSSGAAPQAPNPPTISTVTSPTNVTSQNIGGSKDADTSVWINGVERVTLNASTSWNWIIPLSAGSNAISVTSKNTSGNESSAATSNTVVDTVSVGANPWGVAITPDGNFAYVANNNFYAYSFNSVILF